MPRPLNDLTGQKLGRLTVISRYGKSSKPVKWLCVCDCGTEKIVAYKHLATGSTISCGCYRAELKPGTTHGHSGKGRSKTYVTWEGIKQRCYNPNAVGYDDYGGRGIQVCERWRSSFENFLEDMGERPRGLTLDRIDNDGNYEPCNCRWATKREQSSNRRNSRIVEHGGKSQTLTQWADECGLSRGVLWHRLYNMEWPMDRALNTPVRQKAS